MIIITGTISTKPAVLGEILRLCREHSVRSRREAGCISHNIHVDGEDPNRLFFYEQWKNEAAVVAHFQVRESQDFVMQLTKLVGYRPEMQIYRTEQIAPNDL